MADNTGTELALDLALVGALLEDEAARVTVHLKLQPVFVSDALPRDVWRIFARMKERGGPAGRLADRLRRGVRRRTAGARAGSLLVGSALSLAGAGAPPSEALRSATLVVCKGDANYRRVIGDACWPASAPFSAACGYLGAPLVCLRTMKSDALVGVAAEVIERLDATDPEWRVVGRCGLHSRPTSPRAAEDRVPDSP